MRIKLFQVDAFTNKLFGGNPAAVCVLGEPLSDALMQSIAAENNLAETAFITRAGDGYDIRWFTPVTEVDLCGHATLAAAHVIFNFQDPGASELDFNSCRSGLLKVKRKDNLLTLDFPADDFKMVETPPALAAALGMRPAETWKGKTDHMAVFSCEQEIMDMRPDFGLLAMLGGRGIIVTAKGETVDFVSRFFAPQSGIDEDPVTGSAHTTLIPYWAKVLGKNEMSAIQLSRRKGHLLCRYLGSRVEISGYAVTYLVGEIEVG